MPRARKRLPLVCQHLENIGRDALELESLVLRIVKPKGNEVKGKFAKSRDLRRKFARDIRLVQQHQLDLLMGRVRKADIELPLSNGRRAPVMSAYFEVPTRLRAIYKGKTLRAHVRRDGRIRFSKNVYDSPSAAAFAAKKHASDGWTFWKYERAPGDWVRLSELRK